MDVQKQLELMYFRLQAIYYQLIVVTVAFSVAYFFTVFDKYIFKETMKGSILKFEVCVFILFLLTAISRATSSERELMRISTECQKNKRDLCRHARFLSHSQGILRWGGLFSLCCLCISLSDDHFYFLWFVSAVIKRSEQNKHRDRPF